MTFLSTPLMKSFVGYDNLFDEFEKVSNYKDPNFPAYNIEKLNDTDLQITIALAGYTEDEINVETKQGLLTISGANSEPNHKHYIHRGIANRSFCRQFRIAENIEVREAMFLNGMLTLKLHQNIPEVEKAKKIVIKTSHNEINKKVA
jgi:molecular chaperone IbpA